MIYLRFLPVDWKHNVCLISKFSWDVEMIFFIPVMWFEKFEKKEFIIHSLLNIDKYVK